MEKKKTTQLSIFIIFLVGTIFLLQFVSALTANSSNYSVSMFGTGMASETPSSENYNSTFLSEAKGTTRNAESNAYTSNIGFFENTIYYRTASITSYSISPISAVVGSTIGLYISALNSQNVWAKITSPNNQQQTINLVNNEFITYSPPSLVGTYSVTFYANSSTGAIASVVSSFELTTQTSSSTSSSGGGEGGGGTTTIIEKCTYLWDCTPWSLCADGKQKRICTNTETCNGTESKPAEEMECSQALFDISLNLKHIELTENRNLKFNIDLTEKIGVEKIDVYIKYSIINKENYEIFSQIETKAIQKNLSYEKEIEEIKLLDGEYILRVEILYGYQQRAFAEQKIKIIDSKIEITPTEKKSFFDNIKNALNKSIVLIVLISIFYSLFIFRKDYYRERYSKFIRIKTRHVFIFIAIFLGIIVFGFDLITKSKTSLTITGKTILSAVSKQHNLVISFVLILVTILILLILKYREKIKESAGIIEERLRKKYPENSLKRLINKKVYSSEGMFIGKVKNIVLGENKIDSLKVDIDKKYKLKTKGIVMKYKHVRSIGHVVIIDEKILDEVSKF